MNDVLVVMSWPALVLGALFFVTGAVGLTRFRDLYCRLHAVGKVDSAGYGLLTLGLALRAESWQAALLLILIWILVMISSATNRHLLARYGEGGHPHMGEHTVRERSRKWTS
jgi:multicomponent Na+:H+ antiporter subunit G